MKKLILIFICLPFLLFTQNNEHIIAGIDLNTNWQTLTNQSVLSYSVQENYRKENNIPGVSMNISNDYLIKYADKDFLDIGFTDIGVVFEQGIQSNLDVESPIMFTATLKYNSNNEYDVLSEKAFSKIASILMYQFGPPNTTMNKNWGANFEWVLNNAQLILNMNSNDHINIWYMKK